MDFIAGFDNGSAKNFQVAVSPDNPNLLAAPLVVKLSGVTPSNQTRKSFTGSLATSATAATSANIWTTTSSKTFYVTDLMLTSPSTSAAVITFQAGATAILNAAVAVNSPAEMSDLANGPTVGAGQTLSINAPVTTGAPTVYYYISGFEA